METNLQIKWDANGLAPVVVQDRHTGEVRMVAYANENALRATLETREGHFFSRSRNAMWKKGETSGHRLDVTEVWVDCDQDTILYLVDPVGPSCHTGRASCFFSRLDQGPGEQAAPTLLSLWSTLETRRASTSGKSYTRALLDRGVEAIGDKVREEAEEFAKALQDENDERVVSEASDVLYHVLVGLLARGVSLRDVETVLSKRFSRSGHEEKHSRSSSPA